MLAEIEHRLRERERRREEVHDRARHLRRSAQGIMGRLHEGGVPPHEVEELRATGRAFASELRGELADDAPLAADALQECVEALLLDAVVRGVGLPGPDEIGVPPEPYLLGLGDLIGEVRRIALRALADGRLPEAERALALMQELYHELMRFDAPRGIVQLKPKQDAARGMLERTRGDVTLARVLERARRPPGPGPGGAP